ncbi:MAG: helix-turn-helix transcriptional regulator [Pseudomonadota bacterium]
MSDLSQANAEWFGEDAATMGDRLTAAREAAGLTQADLGARLGADDGAVAAWERDMAAPSSDRLSMIAAVLSVSVGWLMNGEGDGVAAPVVQPANPDPGAVLAEVRALRADAERTAKRLTRLEARLTAAVSPSP